ncbi:MAG TPA: HAD-IA family hydrolase [Solirubrobacteraceae bacterium]|jgi:putative hydrolase of the HAD superfamily|nr:HAD-IA family hydrolase [Solirubrobacteraceae bacterium]
MHDGRLGTTTGRFGAVIFDLWKTLIPFPDELKSAALRATVQIAGGTISGLGATWNQTRHERETMALRDYLNWLSDRYQLKLDERTMSDIERARRTIHGSTFKAISDETVRTLTALRSRRVRTALISNCSSDVADMLASSRLAGRLDTIVLSAQLGVMKPDARIYQTALDRLDVDARDAIYVGDGSDRELEGAAALGLTAVKLTSRKGDGFPATQIENIAEILTLV